MCERDFYDYQIGIAHHYEHYGLSMCMKCNDLVVAAEFNDHVSRVHSEIEYKCRFCCYMTRFPSKMKIHERETHTGPWFRCSRCCIVIKAWGSFRRHANERICAIKET